MAEERRLFRRDRVPIRRNPDTRQAELCLPGWWKWAAGIAAGLVQATLLGAGALLWSMNGTVSAVAMSTDSIERRLTRVEDQITRDPFDGSDGVELENRIMTEMNRRHP